MINIKTIIMLVAFLLTLPTSSDGHSYGNNNKTGKFADINGIQIYYEVYGSGEPVLLIHGNGDSIAKMHFQIEYFSKNNQVIVVDNRGHGKSGLGKGTLTYIQMMEDYNSLLEKLQIKTAKVFGWSDGGILAILLGIHHPDKIDKIAIMGANLKPGIPAVNDWVPPLLEPMKVMIDDMIKKGDTTANWTHQKQLLALLLTQPNISVSSLKKITAPVLVIAGDKDIIRGSHTLEIFENLPNAHLAILPGQTHWAPATDPIMFNQLVDKFFFTPYERPTSKAILEKYISGS